MDEEEKRKNERTSKKKTTTRRQPSSSNSIEVWAEPKNYKPESQRGRRQHDESARISMNYFFPSQTKKGPAGRRAASQPATHRLEAMF